VPGHSCDADLTSSVFRCRLSSLLCAAGLGSTVRRWQVPLLPAHIVADASTDAQSNARITARSATTLTLNSSAAHNGCSDYVASAHVTARITLRSAPVHRVSRYLNGCPCHVTRRGQYLTSQYTSVELDTVRNRAEVLR
jgi:hypothetical protein